MILLSNHSLYNIMLYGKDQSDSKGVIKNWAKE